MRRVLMWLSMSLLATTLAAVALLPIAHNLEIYLYPVKSDWKVTMAYVDGDELVISGSMIKHRNCQFIPPTRTRDQSGINYLVESTSPTAGKSWLADDEPQAFGPWRVPYALGRTYTFYQQDRCHIFWDLFSELGEFNTDTMTSKTN